MKMKIAVIALLIISSSCTSRAGRNIIIKEIGWSLTLPKSYSLSPMANPNPEMKVYQYRRSAVYDSKGRAIFPNIAILIEDVPDSTDVVLHAATKMSSTDVRGFRVVKLYAPSDSLFSVDAIGQLIEYSETIGGTEYLHRVYVL